MLDKRLFEMSGIRQYNFFNTPLTPLSLEPCIIMPELPEVETIKRDLEEHILRIRIVAVEIIDPRVIHTLVPKTFCQKLTGQIFQGIERRGKSIVITFKDQTFLVVQVKMTGFLVYGPKLKGKDTKVVFTLSNGAYLNYNDQRLFGWLIYARNLNDVKHLNALGPEPLGDEFQFPLFYTRLKKRSVPIKPLLMDQQFIAGIGNIYASEILFRSGIRPTKISHKITRLEAEKIFYQTRRVLEEAVRLRGTSMRNYRDLKGERGNFMSMVQVYGRHGQNCFVCEHPIQKMVQSQRSTFFCKKCQK
ncbi:MAG: bifunctional DNA-formamidopyrimidine glycosylase/DNA-(apurinic or apyrimidinic site) lyase, partial [Candidatus Omnitrophica bacterium]|nr:bifunctional DNA-formamidopyrimidine glycosylase/DNA-(apurinic or apyrimidinic site) lyase [Candidatus Omnitrophota bacterium]